MAAFLGEATAEKDDSVLAHHWRESGDRGRAVDSFLTAAEQASRGWAKEEAVRLYNEALALVPDDEEERRRTIRLRLAVAQQMLFHVVDAERLARGARDRPDEG